MSQIIDQTVNSPIQHVGQTPAPPLTPAGPASEQQAGIHALTEQRPTPIAAALDTAQEAAPNQLSPERAAQSRRATQFTQDARMLDEALKKLDQPGAQTVVRDLSQKLGTMKDELDEHIRTQINALLSRADRYLQDREGNLQGRSQPVAGSGKPSGLPEIQGEQAPRPQAAVTETAIVLWSDVHMAADGTAVRKGEVSEDILRALLEFKTDLVNRRELTLEGFQQEIRDLDAMMDRIDAQIQSQPDSVDTSPLTAVKTRLLEIRMQTQCAIQSRTHLNDRLTLIQEVMFSEASPAEKLTRLSKLRPVWKMGLDQTAALARMENRTPESIHDLHLMFEGGVGIVNGDFQVFDEALTHSMRELMCHEFYSRGLTLPDGEVCAALLRHCLHEGDDPAGLVQALMGGTAWTSGTAHQDDVLKAFFAMLRPLPASGDSGETVSRRMSAVDMLFQGAPREYADTALMLKKFCCPGQETLAELQHLCLMTGRDLLGTMLDGTKHHSTRTGAVKSLATASLSARSFLLTPELMKAVRRQTQLSPLAVNYHLAHVAVLQMRALQAGVFPAAAESHSIMSVQDWCRRLGLPADIADYAGALDDSIRLDDPEAQPYLRQLLGACAHFQRGLEGSLALSEAKQTVHEQAEALSPAFASQNKENAFYQVSGDFLAREALDRLLADLTGIISEDRFAHEQGFELDGDLIDDTMTARSQEFLRDVHAHVAASSGTDIRALENDAKAQRAAILRDIRALEQNSTQVKNLARTSREVIQFRRRIAADQNVLNAMKADLGLVRFSWPHQHTERQRVCAIVVEAEPLLRELDGELTPERRQQVEARLNDICQSLKDVDPYSLARKNGHDEAPDLDMLRSVMLPRARALRFFKDKQSYEGIRMSEADLLTRRIKRNQASLMDTNAALNLTLDRFVKQMSTGSFVRMSKTVSAAVLKVFVDSGMDISRFNLHDREHQKAVSAQLERWGMKLPSSVHRSMVRLTAESLLNPDGTLRQDRLKTLAKDELELSGKESLDARKAELRESGMSRFKAWRTARKEGALGLISSQRRRGEGVRQLMNEASLPGSGFLYSRSRGININTGMVYSPISTQNALINALNLSSPLSVRLSAMNTDSLMVSNLGPNGYQVLLKGGLSGSLGATFKIAVPGAAKLSIPVEGSAGVSGSTGLALTFASREDCEAFVKAFIDSESALHGEADAPEADPSVWLKASQIRFVHDKTVSGDVGISAMLSLFAAGIPKTPLVLTGSLTTKAAASGEVKQSVEENAHGQSITFSRKGRLTLSASLSVGVKKDTTLYTSPKAAAAKAFGLDVEQRFKLETGAQGIMPSSGMEYEFSTGGLNSSQIKSLFLPKELRRKIDTDQTFAAAFDTLVSGLPPAAKLVMKCELKADVLARVRELLATSRGQKEEAVREEARKQASALLSSADSYRPARFVVKNVTPADIAHNWSPGLGAVQYARSTSFMRIRNGEPLTIELPE